MILVDAQHVPVVLGALRKATDISGSRPPTASSSSSSVICRCSKRFPLDRWFQMYWSEHGSDRDSTSARVGQGHEPPLSPLPDVIVFPTNYRISESAVFKAYHKAMDRQPAIDAEVFRKEDTARCEEMFLKLQPGISNGDPRHIDTAVRVLAHKAKLNGYAVEPEQVGNSGGFQININLDSKDRE
jgi:hypothetical protein